MNRRQKALNQITRRIVKEEIEGHWEIYLTKRYIYFFGIPKNDKYSKVARFVKKEFRNWSLREIKEITQDESLPF